MPRLHGRNHSHPDAVHLPSPMRMQVRYAGRVQGVGFRATAQAIADRHSATGWVRNEPEGTVLLEIQGKDTDVQSALDDLRAAMSRHILTANAVAIADSPNELGFQIAH